MYNIIKNRIIVPFEKGESDQKQKLEIIWSKTFCSDAILYLCWKRTYGVWPIMIFLKEEKFSVFALINNNLHVRTTSSSSLVQGIPKRKNSLHDPLQFGRLPDLIMQNDRLNSDTHSRKSRKIKRNQILTSSETVLTSLSPLLRSET